MPVLAKKLGIMPGDRVCILDAPPEAEKAIREAAPGGVEFLNLLAGKGYNMILFWPKEPEGLERQFSLYAASILPDGAIWAVMPKKKYATRRGITFAWEEMQTAGLLTDLVDNKVATVTEEDYGTRFVIRKERRMNYGKPA
jgi:hypothetical protein